MGTVNVPRASVQEWLLPTPFISLAIAAVILDNPGEIIVEELDALAQLEPSAAAPTKVSDLLGLAEVEPFGDVQSFPLPVALAEVEFDNTGVSQDVNSTAAIAVLDVFTGRAPITVEVEAEAGVLVIVPMPVLPTAIGDAEVDLEYYGDGNFPVFPYSFPALFTDYSNIQNAVALVEPSGTGVLDAVAGFADSDLPEITGSVVLSVKGSTPIFPWVLPVVFDDLPANVNLALARLVFDMDSESMVGTIGESSVVINAEASSLPSAVFPWTFPVILLEAV